MSGLNLRSRVDGSGNVQAFFDLATAETTAEFNPLAFYDDFVNTAGAAVPAAGSAVVGYPWVKKIVGAAPPTVGLVANAAGGVVACSLTATSQKQDAALYAADSLFVDVTKGAVFEARVAAHTLATSGTAMVWGLQSAWIDGPDNASFYLQFQSNGSGVVNVRKKDGVATTSASSGVTVLADAYHVFRIDASDADAVVFQIDGANVGTVSFGATGSNAILQPYFSCYKATGTSVGVLYVDAVRVGMNRS